MIEEPARDCVYMLDLISVPGYKITRWDRLGQKNARGGGLCVYSKTSLNAELVPLPYGPNPDLEIGCLSLGNDCRGTINCITVYRPPKGNIKRALESLDQITSYVIDGFKGEHIIHSDFNINYLNKNCKWAKELKIWKRKHNLVQEITSHTRIDNNSATTIDLCFTNVKHIKSSGVLSQTRKRK